MILRIVKMEFREECIEAFQEFFNTRKAHILNFEGCKHVELWQDINNAAQFFTYSHWEDEEALNAYRNSAFFKDTWTQTKAMFQSKAMAWSVKSN